MEITARVANLGKYAAGILADTELSFPTTTRRVQDALRKIGVDGLRYEEIIILDYTASVPLLSSRLGEYARIDELNYLACRLAGMSQEEKAKFSAALEHGDYGGDLSDIIDLTYRLDCYTLLPEIRNYEDYGYHLVESRRDFYLPQKARYAVTWDLGDGDNLTRVLRRGLEAAEDHCLLSAVALNLKRMIKCLK